MTMKPALKRLDHQPYGEDHPYEQDPNERFPRLPVENEPVTLGAATFPTGSAERVWATWNGDDQGQERRREGILAGEDEENSFWEIPLPSFQRGQTITYRLHASDGKIVLHSETFQFTTAGWAPVGEIISHRLLHDGVEVICGNEAGQKSLITVTLSGDSVIKTRLAFFSSEQQAEQTQPPAPKLNVQQKLIRLAREDNQRLVFFLQELKLVLFRQPYRLEVYTRDGAPVLIEASTPHWLVGENGAPLKLRQTYSSPESEGFFGFGERFNALNQRGNVLDVCVYNQYKDQGVRTYLPVPFFLSSQGYGLYIASNRRVVYDLAVNRPDRWSFDADLGSEAVLEHHLISSPQPGDILRSFTHLTGKPALPPAWVFGPWMSGNEWNSQDRLMREVETSLKSGIPVSVVVIEAWSDEITFYIWNDAEYEPKPPGEPFQCEDFTFPPGGRWPDPKGMIDELHRLGIRVILWQNPVIKMIGEPHPQQHADEAYAIENDYCVREEDGTPYRIKPFWFANSLLLDFTNPEAVDWWMRKRLYLLEEFHIDGFKTDGGEHIAGCKLIFHNGMRSDEVWNLYPNLYVGAYYRLAVEKRGGDAASFSRAGFTGAQAYPCHWAGDEASTWEAYRASLYAGLNAGVSGIPFWGWDLAGFSGEIPSSELYLRSAAMAAFCPIMQYHSEFNHHRLPCRDRTPWNIAERTGDRHVIDIYRKFAQLRMQLLPYIESEARRCAETGEPLMRPLFLDWPNDRLAWQINDQYCFGRSLLIAPVLEHGARERSLYLPEGKWQDFWDDSIVTGGSWITRSTPLDIIPVYRRIDLPGPTMSNL